MELNLKKKAFMLCTLMLATNINTSSAVQLHSEGIFDRMNFAVNHKEDYALMQQERQKKKMASTREALKKKLDEAAMKEKKET